MSYLRRAREAFSRAFDTIGSGGVERARYSNKDPFEALESLGDIPAKQAKRYHGARAWMGAVEGSPILRPVITRIATDVGAKDYFVQKVQAGGKWELATEGPAVDWLEDPWQHLMGGSFGQLAELCQGYADMAGSWFALKELMPGSGRLKALIPIPFQNVVGVENRRVPGSKLDGGVWFRLIVPGVQVTMVDVPAAMMVWHREPHWLEPNSPGSGIISCLREEIACDEAAAAYQSSFYANGATPHAIVSVEDASITEGELNKLKARWLKEHQGVYNAFRTMFTNKPLKTTLLQPSQRDMQLHEGRRFNLELGLMAFQLPRGVMGLGDEFTPEADRIYNKIVIEPRMRKLVDTLNRQVFRPHFKGFRLAYKTPVREALNDRREMAIAGFTNGLFNRDTALMLMDQEPVGGDLGGEYMIPGNMFLLDKNGRVKFSTTTPKGSESAETPKSTPETSGATPKKPTRVQLMALEGFYNVADS